MNQLLEWVKRQLTRRRMRVWAYGLLSGTIGGAATAVGTAGLLASADSVGAQVPALNIKQLLAVVIAGGLSNAFAYLRQSPLPKKEDDTAFMPKP